MSATSVAYERARNLMHRIADRRKMLVDRARKGLDQARRVVRAPRYQAPVPALVGAPNVEALEPRLLLSAAFEFTNIAGDGILSINVDQTSAPNNAQDVLGISAFTNNSVLLTSNNTVSIVSPPNIRPLVDVIVINLLGPGGQVVDLSTSNDLQNSGLFPSLDRVEINGSAGDDTIRLDGPAPVQTNNYDVEVNGAAPGSGSDVLVLDDTAGASLTVIGTGTIPDTTAITGYGPGPISVNGIELIHYVGNGADTLMMAPGSGFDATIRVETAAAPFIDRATSNSLPTIEFGNVNTFLVDPSVYNTATVTFATASLSGAANYHTDLESFDTLAVEGADGIDDDYLVTVDAGTSFVTVRDIINPGIVIRDVADGTGAGRLLINTFDGNDLISFNDRMIMPVTVDMGSPTGPFFTDILTVTLTDPSSVQLSAVTGAGIVSSVAADINFAGVERINTFATSIGSNLDIFATTGADQISILQEGINPLVQTNGSTDVRVDGEGDASFTSLTVHGLAGDDVIFVDPQATMDVTIQGNTPTASDSVVVRVTGDTTVTPTGIDSADVAMAGRGDVFVRSAESLEIAGDASGIELTVVGNFGSDRFVHTVTSQADAGSVAVNTLLPVDYSGLGDPLVASGSVVISDPFGLDVLEYIGTDLADEFDVEAVTGTVSLLSGFTTLHVPVLQNGIEFLTLDGLASDDVFIVNTPHPYTSMSVEGGGPGNSDVLRVFDDPFAVQQFEVAPGPLAHGGTVRVDFVPINYLGTEDVQLFSSADDDLTVLDDGADNLWHVDAGPSGSASVQIDSRETIEFTTFNNVELRNVAGTDRFKVHPTNLGANIAGTFDVTGGGADVLEAIGTDANDTVTFIPGTATVNGEAIGFTGLAQADLIGLEGDDTFNVTPDPTVAVFVDGGEPVGVVGDTLNLLPAAAPTFTAGPEGDEGGFTIPGAASVSFDHIEAVNVNLVNAGGTATILGTGGDDNITVVGTGPNSVDVQVNNGPVIPYTNVTDLTVLSLNGDDDVTVDLGVANLGVTFNIDGGLPTAGSDELRVTGVDGLFDDPIWTPTSENGGVLQLTTQAPINVQGKETLIYDGESDADFLTIVGSGRFVHTPGASFDAGRVDLASGGVTLLGIDYENMGSGSTVTAFSTGGNDTLVAQATDGTDTIDVNFTAVDGINVVLTSALGTHVTLLSNDVENYQINALEGDDDVNLNSVVFATGTFVVNAGGPGAGSDTVNLDATNAGAASVLITPDGVASDDQDITGFGGPIDLTGVELITYQGNGTDTVTVDPGTGDNAVRVERGTNADLVTSGNLPDIEYEGVGTFVVDAETSSGTDVVTYATANLAGAAANEMLGAAGDTLVIEGTNLDDDFSVIDPDGAGGSSVAVTDTNSGVTVTETSGNLGRVEFHGLSGLNTVTVDLTGGAITPSIGIEGAFPNHLIVTGTTSAELFLQVAGPTSDSGGLFVDFGATASIDYTGLVQTEITGNGGTDTVAFFGTSGADTYTVDAAPAGFATVNIDTAPDVDLVSFDEGSTLMFDGNAGDDTFFITQAADWNFNTVDIDGDDPSSSDQVTIVGDDTVNETFTYTANTINSGTLAVESPTGNGPTSTTTYNLTDVESLHVDGRGLAADEIEITTQNAIITPGVPSGSGTVDALAFNGQALLGLTYENFESATAIGTSVVIEGTSGDDNVELTAAGVITVTDELGNQNSVDVSAFTNVIINTLGGDDTVTNSVDGSLTSITQVTVIGGDNGPGTDTVIENNVDDATLDFATGSLTGDRAGTGGAFATSLIGVEDLVVNGVDGAGDTNTYVVNSYGADNELQNVTLNGGDTGNDDGDTVDVNLANGLNTVTVAPTSATSATIQRSGGGAQIDVTGFNNAVGNLRIDGGTNADDLIYNGTSGADAITAVQNGADTRVTMVEGATTFVPVDFNLFNALSVLGSSGDDTLTVDNSGGLVLPDVDGIFFDGEVGSDTLNLLGSTAITVATYSAGPQVGSGTVVHDGGTVQTVSFANLEPVVDTVTAIDVNVNATDADNAINYSNVSGDGLIEIDGFESYRFDNKTNLTINALGGNDVINLDNQGIASTLLSTITVNGGASTTGDLVIVNGTTGADTIDFTPTADNTATVTGVQGVTSVQINTTESVSINGQGGDDTLDVNTPGTDNTITLTPGSTVDSGDVQVDSLVPMDFLNLGAGGVLTVTDTGGEDTLIYNGTAATDTFTVPHGVVTAPSILLNSQVGVGTTAIENYLLRGLDGGDTFNITALDDVQIDVEGDQPGSGSDTLNYTSTGATALNLGAATIDDAGKLGTPDVTYAGIETINLDARNQTLSVEATGGDDTLEVTPLTATTGTLQANGVAPVVNYSNINSSAILVDTNGGQDTLVVNGSSISEVIDVSGAAVTATGQTVNYVNAEALTVNGLEGSDTFNVTPDSNVDIFIDGGDPIGIVGDRLKIFANTTSMFSPGPEGDEGGFVIDTDMLVSYDHIEDIDVEDPSGNDLDVTVMGTNGDDDITAQGVQTNVMDVTANDGPVVTYTGLDSLTLLGKNGDDDITVDLNVNVLGVTVTVNGGLPTAGSDELRVTGVDGSDDDPFWTPNAADGGTLQLFGQMPINVQQVETLIFDGESDSDDLTVVGSGADEIITHTPGANIDAGSMQIDSLLAINYENLGASGTVTADGSGGEDTLVANATDNNDDVTVDSSGRVLLTRIIGDQVDLRTIDVEGLLVNLLDGDDLLTIDTDHGYLSLDVDGGSPSGGSDVMELLAPAAAAQSLTVDPNPLNFTEQSISGFGAATSFITAGVELIVYVGATAGANDDTLTVNPGAGAHSMRVQHRIDDAPVLGVNYDEVTSDSLPDIAYTNLASFTIRPDSPGATVATFVTRDLIGADDYFVDTQAFDTLVIEGINDDDVYNVVNPGAGSSVAVTDNSVASTTRTVEAIGSLARLQFNTLDGDDVVTVDVDSGSGSALIDVPITYDGGAGSDALVVTGDGGGAIVVDELIYSPGPAVTEGRLVYENALDFVQMLIDFDNIEPVFEYVDATTLTVEGTDANNAIDYTAGAFDGANDVLFNPATLDTGLVLVDAFETIEFANKGTLVLNAFGGDDVINLNNTNTSGPTGLTAIDVNGGDPTASDTLIVNNALAGTQIEFTPTDVDAATISGAQSHTVTADTVELIVINGTSANDTLNVNTAASGNTITLTPGATVDSGNVRVDSLVPMDFTNMGATGVLTVTDGGGADTLIYNGTAASDTFTVPHGVVPAPSILLNRQIGVGTSDVETYLLRGLGGGDTFNVTALDDVLVSVEGDQPGSGSDELNFFSTGATILNLGAATIDDAGKLGSPDVTYAGLETINVSSNTQDLNVLATAVDDVVEVTPLGLNDGTLQANGVAPVVNFNGTGTFTVEGVGGNDTLVVNGSSAPDTIDVDNRKVTPFVDVNGWRHRREVVNHETFEAVTANGHEGDDIFNVHPDAQNNIPVFIDGGDPIGVVGDVLNITANNTSMFSPGPEGDEGGFVIDGLAPVSFDHIERATVTDLANNDLDVTVMGTQGDDDITAAGVNVQVMDVTVNNGPVVTYNGLDTLLLQGKNGDDDVTVDLNVSGLAVAITVDGGLPTAGSDELRVTGVDGVTDTPSWKPDAADGGRLQLAGQAPITVQLVETLIYDGESDDDHLTVVGSFTDDRFVHTPGSDVDAGSMQIDSLLGIDYENLGNLGTVTAEGGEGSDTLVAMGTDGSDVIDVLFTGPDAIDVDLTSVLGVHVDLLSTNVASYEINALEGDDDVNITALVDASGSFTVNGGGPSAGSDTLNLTGAAATIESVRITPDAAASDDQDVTGLGALIDVTGVELITYTGQNTDDTLTVDPGDSDTAVRVEGSANFGTDLVTSNTLPDVEFTGLDTFVVDATAPGTNVVTFATWFLAGATNTNYELSADAVDSLVIEGVDGSLGGDDSFTVTNPAGAPSVAVTDNLGTNVTVTETSGGLGRLQINSLGGDDLVTVNVDGAASDVIGVPITFDGGAGSDLLIVTGTPATAVDEVIYSPGPAVTEGRLTYEDAANAVLMTIDFDNLEPVHELVTAATLTVNGTNAANAINYTQGSTTARGLISVDAFETIEFENKVDLVLNGLAGDDVIDLNNPNTPTSLTKITVNGGDATATDKVVVNGTTATNSSIEYTPTGRDSGTITGAQPVTVDVATTELLVIDGQGGDDDVTVFGTGADDTMTHTPGAFQDSGDVQISDTTDTLLGVHYENLGLGGSVTIDGLGSDDLFNYLVINGTDVAEFIEIEEDGEINQSNTLGDVPVAPRVTIFADNFDSLTVNALDGDDVIDVEADIPFVEDINILGGGPGGGNTLIVDLDNAQFDIEIDPDSAQSFETDINIIEVGPGTDRDFDVISIDLIRFDGDGDDDLKVETGHGDHVARVQNAAEHPSDDADLVISDFLPNVEFSGIDIFEVDEEGTGNVDVTFVTFGLDGADTYQTNLDSSDSLTIEGNNTADDYTVFNPAGGPVAVTDANGTNVTITEIDNVGRLQINTLNGDDVVTVDVDATDLIGVPITFDGGAGSDLLVVTGTPTTTVDEVIYSPGPAVTEGRLLYQDVTDTTLMTIDFDNLEPVHELVTATTLTVEGTNAANAINYTQGSVATRGLVSVDAFETIEFQNKTDLVIDGLSGDDTINLNHTGNPAGLTAITVTGGDPTGSGDTLIVNNTNDGVQIEFTPAAVDAATIDGAQLVPVTANTVEHVVIEGRGENDTLNVNSPAGIDSSIELTPGTTLDSGDVQVDSLVSMSFTNLGLTGTVTFTDPDGAAGADRLIYNGTSATETFVVPDVRRPGVPGIALVKFAGAIQFLQVAVTTSNIENYTLRGMGGGDTFEIIAGPLLTGISILVEGDEPGSGSDTLNFTSAGGTTLDLGNATIDDATVVVPGGPDVAYGGIETINMNSNGQDLTVLATVVDDVVEVTPLGPNDGTLQANGVAPVVNFNGTDLFTVEGLAGNDTLVVNGTSAPDVIDVDNVNATVEVVGREVVNHLTFEALTANGLQGDDVFNVIPDAANNIPVFIDGGDPIGVVGDVLNITANNTSMFSPGPEGDEGGFVIDGLAAVSFDHIEQVSVTDPANTDLIVTVMGTQGDDDITATGTAPNTVDVTVNDGPVVTYVNLNSLELLGKNGDDDIDIDVNSLALGTFIANGGLPSADADTVTVTGNGDDVNWMPDGVDRGELDATSNQLILILATETLIFDGESNDIVLTVEGDCIGGPTDDTFVHTPGTALDSGNVFVITPDHTLLGIDYVNLGLDGTVNIDALQGNDVLVANGTAANDEFIVSAGSGDVSLERPIGDHVLLTQSDTEELVLNGLASNDEFEINLSQPYDTIEVLGGDQGNTDALRINDTAEDDEFEITPESTPGSGDIAVSTDSGADTLDIEYDGIEAIEVVASGDSGDALIVNDDGADNVWNVFAGPDLESAGLSDRIQIDARESIDFFGMDTVELVNANTSTDVFSVHPTDIGNFNTLTVTGDGDDVLEAIGTGNADTLSSAPGGGAQGTAGVNGVDVQFGGLDTVKLVGQDGDDTFGVTPIVGVTTVVDAGAPSASDVLNVSVDGDARVTQGAVSTSGTVDLTGAGDIDYSGVEELNIDAAEGGSLLTVRGTDDNDTISIQPVGNPQGQVTINDGTVMTFNSNNGNYADLDVHGRFGDDAFSITPIAGVDVTAQGMDPTASDSAVVDGTTGQDAIEFRPTADDAATVQVNALGLVTLLTIESVLIDGRGGDDALTVTTPAGNDTITYTPGATVDAADVLVGSLMPMSYEQLGAAGTVTLADVSAARVDSLVYNGTAAIDTFDVAATTGAITLNSQLVVNTPGVDDLTLNGLQGDDIFNVTAPQSYSSITLSGGNPSASDVANLIGDGNDVTVNLTDPSTVVGGGLGTVNLPGVEHVNLDATNGNVIANGTATDDDITYLPTGTDAGTIVNGGLNTLFNLSAVNGLTIDAGNGTDTVTVLGNSADNSIAVVRGASITVAVDTLQSANVLDSATALVVASGLGDDLVTVTGTGGSDLTVDGDGPTASDILRVVATTDTANYTVTGGDSDGTGVVSLNGNDISFSNVEHIELDAAEGGIGADSLQIDGTGNHDVFTVDATANSGDGTAQVNSQADIAFFNFGNDSSMTLDASGGDDDVFVSHAANWQIATVNVNGGAPTASDSFLLLGTSGNDTFVYVPTAASAATIAMTAGALTTTYDLTGIEAATIDALDANTADTLLVNSPNNAVITPGAFPGEGTVTGTDALGRPVLPLDFRGIEANAVVTGGTALIDASAGDDTITLDANGTLIVTNQFGDQNITDVSAFSGLVLNLLGGDDTVQIDPSALFLLGVQIVGGEPGTGSDAVTVNAATTEPNTVNVNLAAGSVNGIVGGAISLVGVESLSVVGTDGVVDDVNITGLGTPTELATINVDGGDTAGDDGDTVDVTLTSGDDQVTITPANASAVSLDGGPTVVNISGFNNVDGNLNVDGAGGQDEMFFEGSPGDDLVTLIASESFVISQTVGGEDRVPVHFEGIEGLVVNGNNGADQLDVDNSNGLIDLPSGTHFNGGLGDDLLRLIGSTEVDGIVYEVGPHETQGEVTHFNVLPDEEPPDDGAEGGEGCVCGLIPETREIDEGPDLADAIEIQRVSFDELEPVIDVVLGDLTILGTNDSNIINYDDGPNSGTSLVEFFTTAQVSVDNFETFEFGNKTALRIRALAGNDRVDLNNADMIPGLNGAILFGDAGDDVLIGSSGDDQIVGGRGDDLLRGEDGDDELFGQEGDDVLLGGDGDDFIDPGEGDDVIDGGDGIDTANILATVGDDDVLIDSTGVTINGELSSTTNIENLNVFTLEGEDDLFVDVSGDTFFSVLNVCLGDDEDNAEVLLANSAVLTEITIDGGDPDVDSAEGALNTGDSIVITGLAGDDQFDEILTDKVVFGDATVTDCNFEERQIIEGRFIDAKFARTVDGRRFDFIDEDGDKASVFWAKKGIGFATVFRDITFGREADIHSIVIEEGDQRVGALNVKVQAAKDGSTDGETSIGHISGTGVGKVIAKDSDIILGVDMGGVQSFEVDDIRDGAVLDFNGDQTGLKMKVKADEIGKDVSMAMNQILANMKITTWGADGSIEAKMVGTIQSAKDFEADIETTRFQDVRDLGIKKIQVKTGDLISHIVTDILGIIQVLAGNAEIIVDTLLDAATMAAQGRGNKPVVKKVQVTGGDLKSSEFNLMPGTFIQNLIAKAKSGVGGDVDAVINGDLMTGKFGDVILPPFVLNGTLLKKLTTTSACDPDTISATGTDGVLSILDMADGAKIVCP